MSTIETPEEMAKRLRWEGIDGKHPDEHLDRDAAFVRERDKQWIAALDAKATAEHDPRSGDPAPYTDGRVSAFKEAAKITAG